MTDEDILVPTNYDNLSIEDKLKYRENQVRTARDRDVEYNDKITKLEFTIKRKEEELAEKDKEIERLKKNMEFDTAYYVKELVNVRKRVCDEIRDRLKDKLHNYYPSIDYVCMSVHAYKSNEIDEILHQVEKGEL